VVEGAPLLRAYGSKAHRGFESLPLRHTAHQFSTFSITRSRQPRSGDSSPRYGLRGFDKIAEGDFGRRARVAQRARAEGPSQSLPLRHTLGEFSSFSFRLLRPRRSGDNARQGGPEGARREATSNPSLSAIFREDAANFIGMALAN
jgi:hypothetical protein